jgi:hypothetical protein
MEDKWSLFKAIETLSFWQNFEHTLLNLFVNNLLVFLDILLIPLTMFNSDDLTLILSTNLKKKFKRWTALTYENFFWYGLLFTSLALKWYHGKLNIELDSLSSAIHNIWYRTYKQNLADLSITNKHYKSLKEKIAQNPHNQETVDKKKAFKNNIKNENIKNYWIQTRSLEQQHNAINTTTYWLQLIIYSSYFTFIASTLLLYYPRIQHFKKRLIRCRANYLAEFRKKRMENVPAS